MFEKKERLTAIKTVIGSHKIKSQEDLLKSLKEMGFDFTQATLSRDLKQLKITKKPDEDGNYYYTLPDSILNEKVKLTGIVSIEFSKNIGVVKTHPGFANVRAIEIDILNLKEIIGTVAGDDTIIMIGREDYSKIDMINALISAAPNLKTKINT